MKISIVKGTFLLVTVLFLTGCKDSTPVTNMSRADQDKAFAGNRNPNFLKQMQEKYAKQSGPPANLSQQPK